jgi:hypothetical protein
MLDGTIDALFDLITATLIDGTDKGVPAWIE